jgi:hypothetical protein
VLSGKGTLWSGMCQRRCHAQKIRRISYTLLPGPSLRITLPGSTWDVSIMSECVAKKCVIFVLRGKSIICKLTRILRTIKRLSNRMQHAGLYPGKTQLETPVKSE